MKTPKILQSLGLKKHEAEVYEALVELGPATISKIVEHTGLYRPMVYRTLAPLKLNGLVTTVTKGKRKLYAAEPPDKLASLFESLKKNFEVALPCRFRGKVVTIPKLIRSAFRN